MIDNLVKFAVINSQKGEANAVKSRKSLTLRYPCSNRHDCTPYKLTLNPGNYKIECWGSKGTITHSPAYPGKGAYTRGLIALFSKTELYVYVGATGHFNSYMNTSDFVSISDTGGGSTDVRLVYSDEWNDTESLKSRIMVAAGGGGAEWSYAKGGNGGELEGDPSFSTDGQTYYTEECKGSTQTSGASCPKYGTYGFPSSGVFGSAGTFVSLVNDWGGLGGGGYYGGTSYDYSYAGSGGSSFISGHEGCKAVLRKEGSIIEHSNESLHYSGYVFYNTKMISGNKTMPLPSGSQGIWDESNGAFKITVISFDRITLFCTHHRLSFILFTYILINRY